MAHLSIRVLGPFQVSLDGEPLSRFASDKVRALLSYLALSPDRPHRRETLAGLLWPEFPERSARTNLRNTLANLRRVIGDHAASPPFLYCTRQTIQFNGQSDHWLDADAFEGWVATVPQTSEGLEQAVGLVRGLFLEGFALADAAPFEEWLLLQQEHFCRRVVEALNGLAIIYEECGAYRSALAHARRRVGLEPWQEDGQRQLMRLLALSGQRSQALAEYDKLVRSLKEELGAEPSAETRALGEAIIAGKLTPEPTLHPGRPAPVWNLPAPATPFFGREDEVATLEAKLAEPGTRLVTLTGLGGSGKTRLALEVGSRLAERDRQSVADQSPLTFRHGIVFAPLAALDSVSGLVPALADALQFRLEGGQQQLLEFLRRRQILLILDNLEQLLGGAGFLAEILGVAPGVKILATSRERLRTQGEHVLPLGGLPYPEHDLAPLPPGAVDLETSLAGYPAMQLLAEGVRRVRPGPSPSSVELPVMLDICRLVDGLPLALELAASWSDALSLSDILVEAQHSLDFWQVGWPDLPERQHSMRAVFDASWRRLSPAEQAVFSSLTVFRGGFGREAAGQVLAGAAAVPRLLATLVRKSFLQYDPATDRYGIHELLRQFGAEKLAQEPAREAGALDRHSAYYTQALQQWQTDLTGPRQRAALLRMEANRENSRAAWHWAAKHGQADRLDQAMEGLAQFYWWIGPFKEGEESFQIAVRSLTLAANRKPVHSVDERVLPGPSAVEGSRSERLRVLARALAWQSNFSRLTGRHDRARELQRQSLALLDGPDLAGLDTRRERAQLLILTGITVILSDSEQARHLFRESLAIYRGLDDLWHVANALDQLGLVARFTGVDQEARQLFKESLAAFRALGHAPSIARTGANLAAVALHQGQFEEAERLARESSAKCRELEDLSELAYCLLSWGRSLEKLGRLAEAHRALEECLALYSDLGKPHLLVSAYASLSSVDLHLGHYKEARTQAQEALVRGRKAGTHPRIGDALLTLGCVALAEGEHGRARQRLQECVVVFREIGAAADLGWAIAVSSYAIRSLGRTTEAQQHLCQALRILAELQTCEPYLYALPAAALLLAEKGEYEHAVELYALASHYPFVAGSRWFEDVAGNRLKAVAATLPAGRVALLEERGQARDLKATAAELLVELCE